MKTILLNMLCLFPFFGICQDIKTVVGDGITGFFGDGGSCLSAELKRPNTLAFDKYGNMYIADDDNNRIRMVSNIGIIITVAGNGALDYSGDNGPATSAALFGPTSITVDSFGNIYIGTSNDFRIRKVNSAGIISTIAGTGTGGYNGDNIPATDAELSYPYLGAVDHEGNLYFSDDGNRRVRKISPSGIITTIAGNGTNGDTGDGGPASAATLDAPACLNISKNGYIFIPDDYGHCVRMINSAGIITTFAGKSIGGMIGDGIPATDAYLGFPNGVAFDDSGNVYIADYGASVVRKVNNAGIISTIAGTGTIGFSGDGGPATLAEMTPNAVAVDLSGNVYIADINNNRVRRITYNATEVNNITKCIQNLIIYPTPSQNELTITAADKIESVTIANMMGQIVYPQIVSKHDKELIINVALLVNGIYFVRVNNVYAGKFVKE